MEIYSNNSVFFLLRKHDRLDIMELCPLWPKTHWWRFDGKNKIRLTSISIADNALRMLNWLVLHRIFKLSACKIKWHTYNSTQNTWENIKECTMYSWDQHNALYTMLIYQYIIKLSIKYEVEWLRIGGGVMPFMFHFYPCYS